MKEISITCPWCNKEIIVAIDVNLNVVSVQHNCNNISKYEFGDMKVGEIQV